MSTKYERWNEIVHKPLDPRIILKLEQGGNRPPLDYISGPDMEVLLMQAFGPFINIKYGEPVLRKFSPYMRTYKKWNDATRTKEPVTENYTPREVIEVKCTLEIPMVDPETGREHLIVREGFGSCVFDATKEDMCTKGASTDALKKAAYSLGFALELSVGKIRGKENDASRAAAAKEKAWFNEEFFGYGWTSFHMSECAKELNEVKQLCQAANIPMSENGKLAQKALGPQHTKIIPCNIRKVVDFFRKAITEKKEAA